MTRSCQGPLKEPNQHVDTELPTEPKEPPINAAQCWLNGGECINGRCAPSQYCAKNDTVAAAPQEQSWASPEVIFALTKAAPNEPVAPLPSADEHEAFQRWAREQWGDRAIPHNAWLGWQARAERASPQAVPADSSAMPSYWYVDVYADGEKLVSIGHDWLSGERALEQADEQTIIGAAKHLLAFVGYGLPPSNFNPDEAAPQAVGAPVAPERVWKGAACKMGAQGLKCVCSWSTDPTDCINYVPAGWIASPTPAPKG